jgi:hypothetical protein
MISQIESGALNNLTLKTLARTARVLGARLKIDLVPRETAERHRTTGQRHVNPGSHDGLPRKQNFRLSCNGDILLTYG